MMKSISDFASSKIDFLFTDIDDTLTDQGKLTSEAYHALWRLKHSGVRVIPVTGRPAGWCEMIARFWPVDGVVGENGAFYFRHIGSTMKREFAQSEAEQKKNRGRLDDIAREILHEVPGSAIASDQFSRLIDLAIDFSEDVTPLSSDKIDRIVEIFKRSGAQAKISSIHVNGWFGEFDKLTMCQTFMKNEFNLNLGGKNVGCEKLAAERCAFVGDSPNDEPMFQFFPLSFAVANICAFQARLKYLPTYVAAKTGGQGFVEIADRILFLQGQPS